MCTLSYIPKSDSGFILTHNRDESLHRGIATPPALHNIKGKQLYYPQDPLGKGTWIGIKDQGSGIKDQGTGIKDHAKSIISTPYSIISTPYSVISLLNGAFERHEHNPPYRLSRGIILLDLFELSGIREFASNYDLNDIEPFTLFVIEGREVFEFRWDGDKKHLKELDPGFPHFYSSTTLYSKSQKQEKLKWFANWKSQYNNPTASDILHFHKTAGKGNLAYGLIMNRKNMVQTVSISQISTSKTGLSFRYEDLINETVDTTEIGV